jgi:hypothetical protein
MGPSPLGVITPVNSLKPRVHQTLSPKATMSAMIFWPGLLVTLALMASEIYHHDLANRVGRGHVCPGNTKRPRLPRLSLRQRPESVTVQATHAAGLIHPSLECPRIMSTDLNGLTCKTPLAVERPGVAAQRITSSAWKRRVGGIVSPRALAVLRLMTSSNFMGCSTGRSAGLAPLRILSTKPAARRSRSGKFVA